MRKTILPKGIFYLKGFKTKLDNKSKLFILEAVQCSKKTHDTLELEIEMSFKPGNKPDYFVKMNGYYCKNCKRFLVEKNEYDSKYKGGRPNFIYIKDESLYLAKIFNKDGENNEENATFFVRTSLLKCERLKHQLEEEKAEINVLRYDGKLQNLVIPAHYCKDCNVHYIYNFEYEELKSFGIPLCSIFEYEKFVKTLDIDFDFNQESIIHSYGYNVNSIDELSEEQRRGILKFVIENGIMRKHEVIALINHFINLRKNTLKHQYAIEKWKSDLRFLNQTKIKTKSVKVECIKIVKNIGII